MRSALELFGAADKLLSQDELDISGLQNEVIEQYQIAAQTNNYDDFMRILISIERITEYTKNNQLLHNNFYERLFSSDTTKKIIIPQIDNKKPTFTIALLSTIQNIINKLDYEFYKNNEIIWGKEGFISHLLSSVQIPQFFDTIKEDKIYNQSEAKESINKAKIFVPQAEKLWKIIYSFIKFTEPLFSKDYYITLILSMSEYSAQPEGCWTSHSIIQSIADIKSIFDQPPSSSSHLIGEYLLQIISKVSKSKNNISLEGASWCLKQVNYPDLSLHPKIIQFCLSLIENSDFTVKEIGFSSLSHVIQNVNSAELIHFQEPIYSLLSTCITSRETLILSLSLPLMFLLLQSCNKFTSLSPSIIDSLFSTFLLGLNNSNPSICEIYIRNLSRLLDLAGAHVIKYASVLFPYLESMLHVDRVASYEVAILLSLMTCLQRLVACSWPRVPVYRFAIFRSAVSCVVGKGNKCENSVVELAVDILGMLKTCCNDKFKDFETLYESLEQVCPQIISHLV